MYEKRKRKGKTETIFLETLVPSNDDDGLLYIMCGVVSYTTYDIATTNALQH